MAHSYLDIAEEIAGQEGATIEFDEPLHMDQLLTKADLKLLKSTIGKRKWLNVYEWLDRGLG